MTIKTDLKNFYDTEAEKYYYTRNKHRADGYIILNEIKKYISTEDENCPPIWITKPNSRQKTKTISILEFGCGWWRLIKFLDKQIQDKKLNIKINYIWVDLSQKLLDFAQTDSQKFSTKIKSKFICKDITAYTKNLKQESLDFVIWVASFQHMPNQKERLFILKNFYQSLKYNGKLIMLNRSFSIWFIKKFKQVIKKSIIKTIYTIGIHDWRNLDIPRKKSKQKNNKQSIKQKNHYRFYHIFSTKELSLLGKLSWFKISELTYVDKTGHTIKSRKKSNNTLFIWEKKVF